MSDQFNVLKNCLVSHSCINSFNCSYLPAT